MNDILIQKFIKTAKTVEGNVPTIDCRAVISREDFLSIELEPFYVLETKLQTDKFNIIEVNCYNTIWGYIAHEESNLFYRLSKDDLYDIINFTIKEHNGDIIEEYLAAVLEEKVNAIQNSFKSKFNDLLGMLNQKELYSILKQCLN